VNPTQTLGSSGAWDPTDPIQPANPTPNNGHEQNRRVAKGAATDGWGSPSTPPTYPNAWLRLQRRGPVLRGFRSTDGVNWVDQATTSLTDQQNFMYVGPFLAVETGNIWASGDFDVWNAPFDPKFDRLFVAQFRDFADVISAAPGTTINVAHSGNSVVISWTVAGVLLQSPVLGTGANWTAVPGAPNTPTGGSVTLTPSEKSLYFRLQQQ
jgi:hypothetical protein